MKKAFTLIEILVIMGIVGIILSFTTTNLFSLRNKASLNSLVTQINTDLKQQQIKAMIGDNSLPDFYGVYIQQNRYILFRGQTFVSTDSNNFPVDLETDLHLAPSGQSIVFNKGNGELVTGSPNSITINNINTGEHKTFNLNSFGVVSSVN